MQEALDIIHVWCDVNLLTINCKKSQWMKTSLVKKDNQSTALCLGNNIIDRVSEYRYLGLIMDNDLTFKSHRESFISRVNHKLVFFRKIQNYINTHAALTIYKSTILPIIEYIDFVCDYNIKYNNKRLQSLQTQGLYIVYNQHSLSYQLRTSTEILHREAQLFRLAHRRRLHLLSYAYSLTADNTLLDHRDIHTRNHEAILFKVKKPDHYKCYQDPMFRAMSEWNGLDVETRNIVTKSQFICKVKLQIDLTYANMY